jgi:hypothetical protein
LQIKIGIYKEIFNTYNNSMQFSGKIYQQAKKIQIKELAQIEIPNQKPI